jgi:hypothetical protein
MVILVNMLMESNMIHPLLEKKMTFASAAVSKKSLKIMALLFPPNEGLVKRRGRGVLEAPVGPHGANSRGAQFGPRGSALVPLMLVPLHVLKNQLWIFCRVN